MGLQEKKEAALSCKECALKFTSKVQLAEHEKGRRHAKKIRFLGGGSSLPTITKHSASKKKKVLLQCELCGVETSSAALLEQHRQGGPHKLQERAAAGDKNAQIRLDQRRALLAKKKGLKKVENPSATNQGDGAEGESKNTTGDSDASQKVAKRSAEEIGSENQKAKKSKPGQERSEETPGSNQRQHNEGAEQKRLETTETSQGHATDMTTSSLASNTKDKKKKKKKK